MLKDNEKGAVLQIDRETYAIAPHTPCGEVTPDYLRKLADVAEKYGVKNMKITSAYRIALYGIREEDIDAIWQELDMDPGNLSGLCVRSVRCCPGNTWCRLGQKDSMAIGRKLDRIYHGMELPNKMKLAVSGCPVSCAEGWIRDIGLYGTGKSGWVMTIGGQAGSKVRVGEELIRGLDDEAALEAIARVVGHYKNAGVKGRLGKVVEKLGLDEFRKLVADLGEIKEEIE